MNLNLKRGFTLIELLVVIAIIGILSAVVLASLNTARTKGSDAAIQSDIGSVRTQAEIYHNANNNYGTNAAVESSCAAADNLFSDPTIVKQVAAADLANGPTNDVTCNVAANGTAYAVSAALVATPGSYYCVDSTGSATTTTTALGLTGTSC
jgi:prepilin-type N-terminal cleavage/methylation domain-containing protein